MKNATPHGPTVVCDVVIAHHREEGIDDFAFVERISLVGPFGIVTSLVGHLIVLFEIAKFAFLKERIERDVVLRLGVGDVAQVGIEQIVGVKANFQHLVHAAGVGGEVAIATHEEGVFVVGHGHLVVFHILLVVEVRHLHAVLHSGTRDEHTDGAHFVASAEHDDCSSSEDDIFEFHCYHLYLSPNLTDPSYLVANWLILPDGRTLNSPKRRMPRGSGA